MSVVAQFRFVTPTVIPPLSRVAVAQTLISNSTKWEQSISSCLAQWKMPACGPADSANDFEFMRRITLDLTGRIPTQDKLLSFVADTSSDKRAKLIDELLQSPEWVDKWTMYFGDLLRNTDRIDSQSVAALLSGPQRIL